MSRVLGLLLGTEAPVMTPNGVDFSFLSVKSSEINVCAVLLLTTCA